MNDDKNEILYLDIDDICLDSKNPRLFSDETDIDAIGKMIKNQGEKLISLAKSFEKMGINNPADNIVVIEGIIDNKYVVKEGNRRITVLKLINNPELLNNFDNKMSKRLYNFFSTYDKSQIEQSLKKIKVVLFKGSLEEMNEWLSLIHCGEQMGQGRSSWGSHEKENFAKMNGKSTPIMDFIKALGSEINVNEVTKTNWERVIGTTDGREFLGLEKEDDKIEIKNKELFESRIIPLFSKIRNQTHDIVNDKDKRKQLFDEINNSIDSKNIFFSIPNDDMNKDMSSNNILSNIKCSNNVNENKKVEKNNYRVSVQKLLDWKGEGIELNFSELAFLKYYIDNPISIQGSVNIPIKNIFPYFLRLILDISIRNVCLKMKNNQQFFKKSFKLEQLNSAENVSFFNEKKLKMLLEMPNYIFSKIGNYDYSDNIQKMNDYCKYISSKLNISSTNDGNKKFVENINEVIHGSISIFDDELLLKYDKLTLYYLKIIKNLNIIFSEKENGR